MRRIPHVPEPVRGAWLLGVFPAVVGAILANPAGMIAAHGLVPLLVGMVALGVAQVTAIVSEARASGWVR